MRPASCFVALLTVVAVGHCQAQNKTSNDGFSEVTGVTVTVAEMAGAVERKPSGEVPKQLYVPGYPNLWVMELQYKPIRMMRLPVTDPVTKKTQRELVWYMVYRAIPRDYTRYFSDATKDELVKKLRDPSTTPDNEQDGASPKKFAPQFTLVTRDAGDQKVYQDTVLPGVQAEIARREGLNVLNSIQAIGQVPPVAADPKDQKIVEGVVVWRNVDPDTDYVSVFMTGFSNSCRMAKGPAGKTMLERKTVVQDFWRPGDRFDQDEKEFRIQGKPRWIYRAEPWRVQWPAGVRTSVEEVLVTRRDVRPKDVVSRATTGANAGNGNGGQPQN